MSEEDTQDATARLREAGQAHLVEHAATLGKAERAGFLARAAAHPWEEIAEAVRGEAGSGPPPVLRPPVALRIPRQQREGGLRRRLATLGDRFLAQGRVATLLLAGGQGTRLGHDGPKGTYVFGPEADRSLYAILAERVAAVSERVGTRIPLYVLVSEATEAATRAAFQDPDRFGLADDQVRFLVQGMLPAVDESGRALLAGPGRLAEAPDGHGGALTTLVREGVLDDLLAAEVDVLTTFQVDNALARPLDPVMLGWMLERRLQVVTKAVAKASPDERVGVYGRDLRGRHHIVEYSELPEEGAEELDLGSIAIHGFSVAWLREALSGEHALPLHRARKRVPFMDTAGRQVEPDGANAIKLERFLFDVFPAATRFEVLEVMREREFAPIKNPSGVDSADSARLLVEAEVARWHRSRERPVPGTPSLRPRDMDGPAGIPS